MGRMQLIFSLILLHTTSGFVRLDTTPQPPYNPIKGHVNNVSLHHLTSGYLQRMYPDIMSLKITHSKIDKLDKYAFDYLTHLNLLEISGCEIQEQIDPQTFSRIPSLEILILRNSGLKNVELNLTNVQKLIVTGNEIEKVSGESISGKNVNYLDLSNNRMRTLGGSFGNFSKLSTIDISRNEIAEVPPVFKDNINLISVFAAQNKITSTEGLRLPWLKIVDLFANRISSLTADSFSGMKSLEEVILALNNIRHVEDAFKDLIELRYLNLAWNHIEELRPELFRNNPYLTKVSLQGNRIRSLEKFQNVLYHLTHLDVSHNELDLIREEFFQSTPSLQFLDLSFNHLKRITGNMKPLSELRVLNLAFNKLTIEGDELSGNQHLSRVNLSYNALEGGVSHFKNNRKLTDLDLSHNNIVNFCDGDVELKNLLKLNLKGNLIKNLDCLMNLKSLCEVDVRKNPLVCGEELDGLIVSLAEKKGAPYKLVPEFQGDVLPNECENLTLNQSFSLWNSIKRELCPDDLDLNSTTQELESYEEEDVPESTETAEKPIRWFRNDGLNKPNPMQSPQSEKSSWETIEKKSPELLSGFEDEELGTRPRFTWYTIALILIALSLTLTCFNLMVFFYIKMKVWRRNEGTSQQKYTVLHNEVYRNTTEPTKAYQIGESDWSLADNQTRNKVFTYGKINELLFNFGGKPTDKDSESVNNILINSQNC